MFRLLLCFRTNQLFYIFPNDIRFQIYQIAFSAVLQNGLADRMRNGRNGKLAFSDLRHCQANAVNGYGALFNDISHQLRLRLYGIPNGCIIPTHADHLPTPST